MVSAIPLGFPARVPYLAAQVCLDNRGFRLLLARLVLLWLLKHFTVNILVVVVPAAQRSLHRRRLVPCCSCPSLHYKTDTSNVRFQEKPRLNLAAPSSIAQTPAADPDAGFLTPVSTSAGGSGYFLTGEDGSAAAGLPAVVFEE